MSDTAQRVLLPTNDWRNWKLKGCLRDRRGVLRLVIEDWQGNQYPVMAVEAPDWQPLTNLTAAPVPTEDPTKGGNET